MNPSTDPFQNNFMDSHKPGTISVNIPNPTSSDSSSLIALSPDRSTTFHQKDGSSTTYSMDLQGLDFDSSGVHLKKPQLSSSSNGGPGAFVFE
jgi:hypothetical protein